MPRLLLRDPRFFWPGRRCTTSALEASACDCCLQAAHEQPKWAIRKVITQREGRFQGKGMSRWPAAYCTAAVARRECLRKLYTAATKNIRALRDC